MRQAVNKRKETLARKKQKQSEDKVGGQTSTPATPQPESQSQTPGPIPTLPPGVAASAAAQPSPTMLPQQPPREYGEPLHLVGGADYAPMPVHGVRGPSSPRLMAVHDERHQAQVHAHAHAHAQAQAQGYYPDGPHAQHMPYGGGYGQFYSNGGVDERNGGPAAPGWGPQN